LQSDFHFAGIPRVIALDGNAIELTGVEAILSFSDTRNASVSDVGSNRAKMTRPADG